MPTQENEPTAAGDEMSGWLFDEANPIATFTVGVELRGPISPSIVQDVSNRHHLFKRELPRKLEQPFLLFPMPGVPIQLQQNQIAGITFDSVSADGSVARALIVGPNQISYMTASYTRWVEFQPVLERLLGNVLQFLTGGPAVTAFLLTAVNRFRWHGATREATLESMLNQRSRLFAPNILTTAEHCHSFHGYVEPLAAEPKGQYVRNVNIQTGDDQNANRIATISLSHRVLFSSPITDAVGLFVARNNDVSFGRKLTTMMHDRNNDIFRDVVDRVIVNRIPGLSS